MSAKLSAQRAKVSPIEEIKQLNCHLAHKIDINDFELLQSQILCQDKAQRMAEFFSLLGDANRLRIVSSLALKELCVCELAATLNMSESAVSHQLRTLRAMRIVHYQKRGRKVFYRLQDHHILELYCSVAEHLDEQA
ncbi:MAG: helix-turn-helix transcriptional regulator [Merismopedia sp. SIO2A8]|nr:helix-turn-helix transcriptional regulator [Symploca sp. SIO2B6]NET53814.1 helix-turn-helix transcriptional regulator [Merismopedia sp. SIO2A8]